MLKSIILTVASVIAVNVVASAALAKPVTPQKPIEMPPIVVKGERPK